MSSNPVLRQAAAPNLARTDSVLDAYLRGYRSDANDVLHAVEASHDYDPAPGLERIKAPVMAVNFADDRINPPEARHPGARDRAAEERMRDHHAASDRTAGHGTHTLAAVWKDYLIELRGAGPGLARGVPARAGVRK